MILKTQMHTDSEWKFYDFEEIEWKTNYKCIHHEFSKKLNCDMLTLESQLPPAKADILDEEYIHSS